MVIQTAADLIDALGATSISAKTGWKLPRLSMWKTRGLPNDRNVDRELRDLAKAARISVDWDAVYAEKSKAA
jgi:hypothetical protein